MAWSTPKTDWVSADVIGNTDLNRIEGNIAEVANVSGTDAQLAQNATGTLDIGETATTVNLGETATTVNLGSSLFSKIDTPGSPMFSNRISGLVETLNPSSSTIRGVTVMGDNYVYACSANNNIYIQNSLTGASVSTISGGAWGTAPAYITTDGTNLILTNNVANTIYITDGLTSTVSSSFSKTNVSGLFVWNGNLVIARLNSLEINNGISNSLDTTISVPSRAMLRLSNSVAFSDNVTGGEITGDYLFTKDGGIGNAIEIFDMVAEDWVGDHWITWQELTFFEKLISENFIFLSILGLLVLSTVVVIIFSVLNKKKVDIGWGDKKISFGGNSIGLKSILEINNQKTEAKFKNYRETVADQKERIRTYQIRVNNLLTCCSEPKETVIKIMWLSWQNIFDGIADKNAIVDKFDGDFIKGDYKAQKLSQLLSVYEEQERLGWTGLAPVDQVKEELEKLFSDLMLELREITISHQTDLKNTIDGYDKILDGLEEKND
jgi:hypothetical protein